VTIPPATVPTAPPPSSSSTTTPKNDANADASTGFANALLDVAFADATPATRKPQTARQTPRTLKDQNEEASSAPVPVTLPLPTPLPPIAIPTGGDPTSGSQAEPVAAAADGAAPAPPAGPRNSPINAAKPPMPSGASAPPPELTFAARVQPAHAGSENTAQDQNQNQNQNQNQHSSHQGAAAPAPAAAPKKAIESEPKQPATVSEAKSAAAKGSDAAPADAQTSAPVRIVPAFDPSGRLVPPPPVAPSTPSKPVEAAVPVEPVTPLVKAAPQPLKDVSIEVAPPGVQKVEVRLVQQAGELRVAVRTADPDLAHGLREGLPDLVGRLQENGSRAEAWRPGAAIPMASQAAETAHTSGRGHSGDAPSHQGSQQDANQRQRQSSNRPQWVDELESSMTGPAVPSQGEISWHPQLTH
jgi:hypothetical protein